MIIKPDRYDRYLNIDYVLMSGQELLDICRKMDDVIKATRPIKHIEVKLVSRNAQFNYNVIAFYGFCDKYALSDGGKYKQMSILRNYSSQNYSSHYS